MAKLVGSQNNDKVMSVQPVNVMLLTHLIFYDLCNRINRGNGKREFTF